MPRSATFLALASATVFAHALIGAACSGSAADGDADAIADTAPPAPDPGGGPMADGSRGPSPGPLEDAPHDVPPGADTTEGGGPHEEVGGAGVSPSVPDGGLDAGADADADVHAVEEVLDVQPGSDALDAQEVSDAPDASDISDASDPWGIDCDPDDPASCDDGEPCTVDTCVDEIGCIHVPDYDPCSNPGCTPPSAPCLLDTGDPKDCSDDNPCTVEYCDGGDGACVHE